jgi:DNA/RNA-binding domain of Phe-tRNA-synthetase-like protein
MNKLKYSISADIFEKFPDYLRGLVCIRDISNESADALSLLRISEDALKAAGAADAVLTSPKFTTWRDAFVRVGINPSQSRPAHEALARRILQGKSLPDINPAVNIGNAFSIKYLLPIGVHPLDNVPNDIELKFANGTENFVPFGSDMLEHPKKGEVILVEGNEVLTRCWIWRQSKSSATLKTTRCLVVNVDGFSFTTENEILNICTEIGDKMKTYCGGDFTVHLLSRNNRTTDL